MKKYGVFGLLAIATVALALPTNSATAAVVYTVSGTVVDDPVQLGTLSNQTFSFTYTSPTFVTGVLEHVAVSGCTISSADYFCTVASFRPAEVKDFPNLGDKYDQVDFEWTNTDLSGGGGAQLLFTLGAFTAPGTYLVGPISISNNAILTVTVTDVGETPIPGALPLFATGLGAMGLLGWRRKRKAATPAA